MHKVTQFSYRSLFFKFMLILIILFKHMYNPVDQRQNQIDRSFCLGINNIIFTILYLFALFKQTAFRIKVYCWLQYRIAYG